MRLGESRSGKMIIARGRNIPQGGLNSRVSGIRCRIGEKELNWEDTDGDKRPIEMQRGKLSSSPLTKLEEECAVRNAPFVCFRGV